MDSVRRKGPAGTSVSPVLVPQSTGDPTDRREADYTRRLAALEAREAAFAAHVRAAREVLAAADRRDALADARDEAADRHDRDLDLAEFLADGDEYGAHLPVRRAAALGREHAKDDRRAARRDRIALTQGWLDDVGLPALP